MNHAQNVFLAHTLTFCTILQASFEYYVYRRKKARQCANIDGLCEEEFIQ